MFFFFVYKEKTENIGGSFSENRIISAYFSKTTKCKIQLLYSERRYTDGQILFGRARYDDTRFVQTSRYSKIEYIKKKEKKRPETRFRVPTTREGSQPSDAAGERTARVFVSPRRRIMAPPRAHVGGRRVGTSVIYIILYAVAACVGRVVQPRQRAQSRITGPPRPADPSVSPTFRPDRSSAEGISRKSL